MGRFIAEDGVTLPEPQSLEESIRRDPSDPLTAARADLLAAMRQHGIAPGRSTVVHGWKQASILAAAFRRDVPITVHPGIGYDIIANHPMFHGAAIGRAAHRDFAQFGAAAEGLDGGVVLSVGSAIMGPQVFEKSLSCANNLRLQAGRQVIAGHTIYVVDIQDGGGLELGDRRTSQDKSRLLPYVFARATHAWADQCTIFSATIWPSSTTCCSDWGESLGQFRMRNDFRSRWLRAAELPWGSCRNTKQRPRTAFFPSPDEFLSQLGKVELQDPDSRMKAHAERSVSRDSHRGSGSRTGGGNALLKW